MAQSPKDQGHEENHRGWNVFGVLYHRARTLRGLGLACFILLLAVVTYPQTQHSIKVSWTITQNSDPATGFNIYRGVTTGGPYTKQNATTIPLATPAYTDTSGVGGTTYFYVVTSVDANNFESAFSTQVSSTFLANPAVPSGVTAISQ